ncbi:hypothetical protein HAZT_HAZT009023 [Hyalella azteca]|uniref:Endonuclease/exonuclease/phosphatase domain-containing protein n=1 Tax=Hyalella azteca TaxID=294128 RepID=A0A6A0GYA9_HYAAZ|nr:hypothetical protein HAZT_HAZT009023 [Hyalella azteca]
MGDLNAKVGSDNSGYERTMGVHGLGMQNDNGERLYQDRRRVVDVVLTPKDTCCAQTANGYCLVSECDATNIGFCEVKIRCEAQGLLMASRELYYNYSFISDPTLHAWHRRRSCRAPRTTARFSQARRARYASAWGGAPIGTDLYSVHHRPCLGWGAGGE